MRQHKQNTYFVKDFIKNLVVRDGIVIPNTACRAPFAYAGATARTDIIEIGREIEEVKRFIGLKNGQTPV